MFRRSILGVLTIAAGVGAALALKYLSDVENQEEDDRDLFDGDEEVHFIHIDDDDSISRDLEDDYEAEIPSFDKKEEVIVEEKEDDLLGDDVKEICAVYPYLKPAFVDDLLHKNDEFDEKYPEGTLVTISHAMKFTDDQSSEIFMKIADEAGYVCTKVGLSITATKKIFTQSGAIISDILNVSNQALALGGEYLEYTID